MPMHDGRDAAGLLRARRVLVLGSPGSGKSTLSRKLSSALGLPLWSMDDLYWEAGWRRPREIDFLDRLAAVVQQERWIIDGNFDKYLGERLKRCDFAILLDISPWRCLWRFTLRAVRRRLGDKTSLPKRVAASKAKPETLDAAIFGKILRFRDATIPAMTARIEATDIPLLRMSVRDSAVLIPHIESLIEQGR